MRNSYQIKKIYLQWADRISDPFYRSVFRKLRKKSPQNFLIHGGFYTDQKGNRYKFFDANSFHKGRLVIVERDEKKLVFGRHKTTEERIKFDPNAADFFDAAKIEDIIQLLDEDPNQLKKYEMTVDEFIEKMPHDPGGYFQP